MRASSVSVRLYPEEEQAVKEGCEVMQMNPSEFIRMCIRTTAKRLLED